MHGAMLHCPGGRGVRALPGGVGKIFAGKRGSGNAQGRCLGRPVHGAMPHPPPLHDCAHPPTAPSAETLESRKIAAGRRAWGSVGVRDACRSWGTPNPNPSCCAAASQSTTLHALDPPTVRCGSHLRLRRLRPRGCACAALSLTLVLRRRRSHRLRRLDPRSPHLRLCCAVSHNTTRTHSKLCNAVLSMGACAHPHAPPDTTTPPPPPTPRPSLASGLSQKPKKSNEPGFAASHSRP